MQVYGLFFLESKTAKKKRSFIFEPLSCKVLLLNATPQNWTTADNTLLGEEGYYNGNYVIGPVH